MKKISDRTKKIYLIVAGLFLFTVLAVVRKLTLFAAEPADFKNCVVPPGSEKPTETERTGANRPRFASIFSSINDASCLNNTRVYGVIDVRTVEDVQQAVLYARDNGLKVSMAGARHSMGGQAFAPGSIVLNMVGLSQIEVHPKN